ncbi:MAG: phosphoribosylanthranilate isomerase [Planctomycetota bacterium]
MQHATGRLLFHVKVCGVTSAADARLAANAGVDAVGFNFVPGSPRAVSPLVARQAAAALPAGVLAVGVFAGMPAAEMLAIAEAAGLGAIQLHGHLDETAGACDPPIRCHELAGLPVIRAVRLEAGSLAPARRWLAAAAAAGGVPAMLIVDAGVTAGTAPGQLGGTGHVVDWQALAREEPLGLPFALAGGLTPGNVAAAVHASRCQAVDTASGVEAAPGRKDPGLVRAFVAAARDALGLGG